MVTTPIASLALPVGSHRLTIAKPGYVAQTELLEIRAMGTTCARYALIAERGAPVYRRWWFWAAVGAVAITARGSRTD